MRAGPLQRAQAARVAGCPSEVPAAECAVDPKTDCPTAGPIAATPPQRCVPSPSSRPQVDTTVGPAGATRCAANFFVEAQVPKGAVAYEAVWYSTFGLGTRWFTNGTPHPGKITGIGATFDVPKGDVAWSASYSDCGAPSALYVRDSGMGDRLEVPGRAAIAVTIEGTNKPAPKIHMRADCPSGSTTVTDDQGDWQLPARPWPHARSRRSSIPAMSAVPACWVLNVSRETSTTSTSRYSCRRRARLRRLRYSTTLCKVETSHGRSRCGMSVEGCRRRTTSARKARSKPGPCGAFACGDQGRHRAHPGRLLRAQRKANEGRQSHSGLRLRLSRPSS